MAITAVLLVPILNPISFTTINPSYVCPILLVVFLKVIILLEVITSPTMLNGCVDAWFIAISPLEFIPIINRQYWAIFHVTIT